METISYDFSGLEKVLNDIKTSPSPSNLNKYKKEVNTFFNDSVCKDVLYTQNNDGLFFGMCVMPDINGAKAIDILTDEKAPRIQSYFIEFDSKLFNPILNLSKRELTAISLHEIGHIVKDNQPLDDSRKAVDIYLNKNRTTLSISDSIHYRELLAFAIKDSIRKFTSMFEKEDEEIIADEFVVRCGYGQDLESAYKKIVKNNGKLNRDVNSKLLVMDWTMRLYKDVKFQRINAIRTLNKTKSINSSKLEQRNMDIVIRSLNKIDDDALMESTIIREDLQKNNSFLSRIKYNGMRALEDDVYEYNMRVRNVDSEEDALYILRQINSRMSVIDDYLCSGDISEDERKRWLNVYDKYGILRDMLGKKAKYNDKYYNIFMDYSQMTDSQR